MLAGSGQLRLFTLLVTAVLTMLAGSGAGYVTGCRMTVWSWVPKMMVTVPGTVDLATVGARAGHIAQGGALLRPHDYFGVLRAPIPILLGAMQFPVWRWIIVDVVATILVVGTLSLSGFAAGKFAAQVLGGTALGAVVPATTVALGVVVALLEIRSRSQRKAAR
jgi:membrane protein DedA with SNARE-associated domain